MSAMLKVAQRMAAARSVLARMGVARSRGRIIMVARAGSNSPKEYLDPTPEPSQLFFTPLPHPQPVRTSRTTSITLVWTLVALKALQRMDVAQPVPAIVRVVHSLGRVTTVERAG
ncbi:uncharacterized protein PHALS_11210 [Plasmopara halstedii]|uniref:Uncharacterized protein n=1 Tax=Plasmopara halstedii TaxID=4781 RepID=A0A0P1AID6_PLAHL|nr:uncharacterized protein PHALS_11210 [Plasmopara halstedii]CEG41041.1 hypothetical protein PHALS_11210 [Plasmopara halstedii]|eukprot:XP_024577410.1 hypothetical protein PHALS_11210 [Plasmopara halstedii]